MTNAINAAAARLANPAPVRDARSVCRAGIGNFHLGRLFCNIHSLAYRFLEYTVHALPGIIA